MSRFKVITGEEALELGVKEIDEYYDYEYCYFLVDTEKKEIIHADGGEPEDQTLCRDWDWVCTAMNKLYEGTYDD